MEVGGATNELKMNAVAPVLRGGFAAPQTARPPAGVSVVWWRRRESNPRPQALRSKVYMLILSLNLASDYPTGREDLTPAQ